MRVPFFVRPLTLGPFPWASVLPATLVALALGACGGDSTGPAADTTAPTIQIQSPGNATSTTSAALTVTGSASDDDRVAAVSYRLNGGGAQTVSITPGPMASFSFQVVLAAGQNEITVTATDGSGNVETIERSVYLDAAGPELTLTSLPGPALVITETVPLASSATDAGGVTRVAWSVNGGAAQEEAVAAGTSVPFDVDVPVGLGVSTVTVSAWDQNGQRTDLTRSVERVPAGLWTVTVQDAADGSPIEDLEVSMSLQDPGAAPVAAAAAGQQLYEGSGWTVAQVSVGRYEIRGPVGQLVQIQLTGPGLLAMTIVDFTFDGSMVPPDVLQMIPSGTGQGTVRGRVTSTSGQPIGAASLCVSDRFTLTGAPSGSCAPAGSTDQDGAYQLSLAAGYYVLEVQHERHESGNRPLIVVGGFTVEDQDLELVPSQAATPGRIVFASDRDGNAEIYIMDADGSDVRRLTNHPATDYMPALSPDGEHVAWTSQRDGLSVLYRMRVDGTDLRRIGRTFSSNFAPSWSPDGTQIAFEATYNGYNSLWIMSADGSGDPVELSNVGARPHWGANGLIVFHVPEGAHPDRDDEIRVYDPGSGSGHTLTDNAWDDQRPEWSPDGSKIVYASLRDGDWDVFLLDVGSGEETRLTDHAGQDYDPSFSPDGRKVAFITERDAPGTGRFEIYAIDLETGSLENLTDNPADDQSFRYGP